MLLDEDTAQICSAADSTALAEKGSDGKQEALETWNSPEEKTSIQKFLYPEPEDLPDDFSMPIWDHLDELRERVIVAALAAATAVLTCFCFSKDLVVFLEAPVAQQGVRFLQLSPGEFFFTTIKVGLWVIEYDNRHRISLNLSPSGKQVDLR